MGITRYFDPRLSEELRLRSGILRKEALVRSLDFRRQFYDWQHNNRHTLFAVLRKNYEATFFDDASACSVFRRQQNARVVFKELRGVAATDLSFLLDEFKQRCLINGFRCFRAESWKLLQPEEGVEVHQRYLLHNIHPGWLGKLFGRWLDQELLVLEGIFIDQHKCQLEIRLYPAKNRSVETSIDRLMGHLLRET